LSSEEGEAKDSQRAIHDLAANGLEANPCVINEKAQWYGKMAIRSDEEQARHNTENRRVPKS